MRTFRSPPGGELTNTTDRGPAASRKEKPVRTLEEIVVLWRGCRFRKHNRLASSG